MKPRLYSSPLRSKLGNTNKKIMSFCVQCQRGSFIHSFIHSFFLFSIIIRQFNAKIINIKNIKKWKKQHNVRR